VPGRVGDSHPSDDVAEKHWSVNTSRAGEILVRAERELIDPDVETIAGTQGYIRAAVGVGDLALTERGVQIRVGNNAIGQGTRTMHAQIVADALGISYDELSVSAADTSAPTGIIPHGGAQCGICTPGMFMAAALGPRQASTRSESDWPATCAAARDTRRRVKARTQRRKDRWRGRAHGQLVHFDVRLIARTV
jgi:hypothetical protein